MPTSDPGLRWVTAQPAPVHARRGAYRDSDPVDRRDILRPWRQPGDGGALPAVRLGRQLANATTLAQCGIRDGAVLVLHKSMPSPPRCDDVAEAVAAL